MIRVLAVAAAVGAISVGLAPAAASDSWLAGSGYGANPEPPATPVSQANAVQVAENYLSVMGFSRSGLINQLVSFDGFSNADAAYAVDSIDVDWNEQAVRVANNYLSVMGFSRQGLIEQLISFDGFTPSQAAYGVAATGL